MLLGHTLAHTLSQTQETDAVIAPHRDTRFYVGAALSRPLYDSSLKCSAAPLGECEEARPAKARGNRISLASLPN